MEKEIAIALPFTIDPFGNIGSTQDQTKIWADKVRSVIGTTLRERCMRPAFGTVIPYALFDSQEDAVTEVQNEVSKVFNEQLRLLRLTSVDATIDEYTNVMNVDITYSLPNSETVSTNIGLVKIDGISPAYQELL